MDPEIVLTSAIISEVERLEYTFIVKSNLRFNIDQNESKGIFIWHFCLSNWTSIIKKKMGIFVFYLFVTSMAEN